MIRNGSGVGVTEISKLIAAAWKEVSDEEKAKYKEMQEKDKEIYKEAMTAYKAKQAAEGGDANDDSDNDDDNDTSSKPKVGTKPRMDASKGRVQKRKAGEPKSANWEEEMEESELVAKMKSNIDHLPSSADIDKEVERASLLHSIPWLRIVLDEAHKIKVGSLHLPAPPYI